MIKASFFYPNKDGAKFDHQYFQETHIGKLVKDRWSPMGMKEFGAEKGLGGGTPGSPAPYVATGYVVFETVEEFGKAMEAHGAEIVADIKNYTDLEPIVQVSEIVT